MLKLSTSNHSTQSTLQLTPADVVRFVNFLGSIRYDLGRDALLFWLVSGVTLNDVQMCRHSGLNYRKNECRTVDSGAIPLSSLLCGILDRAIDRPYRKGAKWRGQSEFVFTRGMPENYVLECASRILNMINPSMFVPRDLRASVDWYECQQPDLSKIAEAIEEPVLIASALTLQSKKRGPYLDDVLEKLLFDRRMLCPDCDEMDGSAWVTEQQAAEIVGLSLSWFRQLHTQRKGPPHTRQIQIGRIYNVSMLHAWLARRSSA